MKPQCYIYQFPEGILTVYFTDCLIYVPTLERSFHLVFISINYWFGPINVSLFH